MNEDGFREVLGAAEGMKEDKASWVIVCHQLPVEHGRRILAGVSEKILADDDDGQSGGSHVLLRARVDKSEFAHVHRGGEDVRRHIAHDGG